MLLKILCRALGHRIRVVQEFSPVTRRVKCVRCDGDWGMHDDLRVVVPWGPAFERLHREHGCKILEPLPAWRSVPVKPLTSGEVFRATRWAIVVSLTLTMISTTLLEGADFWVRILVAAAIGWGVGCLLVPRSIDRAYERKCNSLEA